MEIKLNLASKPYLNRQAVRVWLFFACAVLVVLLLINATYGYQSYKNLKLLDSRFEELDKQVTGIKGAPAGFTSERYAAVKAEIKLAKEIINADQFRWTSMLGRFEEVVPKDVSIRSIQPDFKERSVQVSGVARDVSAMTRFLDNLLLSDDFNQSYLQRHGDLEVDMEGRSQTLTGFSLVIREAF